MRATALPWAIMEPMDEDVAQRLAAALWWENPPTPVPTESIDPNDLYGVPEHEQLDYDPAVPGFDIVGPDPLDAVDPDAGDIVDLTA